MNFKNESRKERLSQRENGERDKLISPASSYDVRVADSASRKRRSRPLRSRLKSSASSFAIQWESYDFTSVIPTAEPEQKYRAGRLGVENIIKATQERAEVDISMVDSIKTDIVFSIAAETIQNLTPEKWKELLALKALNENKLHILIQYDQLEELTGARVAELRNDFKNVYVGPWSIRIPEKAPVFYFSDPGQGTHPSARLDPRLAQRINGKYFGMLFGVALLFEYHDENLPGLVNIDGYWQDPNGWYASEVLNLLFKSYVAVAAAA